MNRTLRPTHIPPGPMQPLCVHSESRDWGSLPRDCVAVSSAERFRFKASGPSLGQRLAPPTRRDHAIRYTSRVHWSPSPRRARQATRLTRLLRSPFRRCSPPPVLSARPPLQASQSIPTEDDICARTAGGSSRTLIGQLPPTARLGTDSSAGTRQYSPPPFVMTHGVPPQGSCMSSTLR